MPVVSAISPSPCCGTTRLPNWSNTLVICSSHSGNTEETLSVFDQAIEAGLPTLAICTGGKLAEKAKQAGAPLWIFEDDFQPRAAVGFSFGLLLAALTRLGLFPAEADRQRDPQHCAGDESPDGRPAARGGLPPTTRPNASPDNSSTAGSLSLPPGSLSRSPAAGRPRSMRLPKRRRPSRSSRKPITIPSRALLPEVQYHPLPHILPHFQT